MLYMIKVDNGPLPTGNEVIGLVSCIFFDTDQLGDILQAFAVFSVKLYSTDTSNEHEFIVDARDRENITVTKI